MCYRYTMPAGKWHFTANWLARQYTQPTHRQVARHNRAGAAPSQIQENWPCVLLRRGRRGGILAMHGQRERRVRAIENRGRHSGEDRERGRDAGESVGCPLRRRREKGRRLCFHRGHLNNRTDDRSEARALLARPARLKRGRSERAVREGC